MQPTYHTDKRKAIESALEMARLTQEPTELLLSSNGGKYVAVPARFTMHRSYFHLHTVRPDGVIED